MSSPRKDYIVVSIMVLGLLYATFNGLLGCSLYSRNFSKPFSESAITLHDMTNTHDEYRAILTAHADSNKTVILALVDVTFMDMALNFHETSLMKFSIRNYLFIGTNLKACSYLIAKHIPCYVYINDTNAEKTTVYGTKGFNSKMNIRTFMILDALQMGFTVLHTDVDIVFFRNPIADIKCVHPCEMTALWDEYVFNAGFLLIRPTNSTKQVYTLMRHFATTTPMDDQNALNKAVGKIRKGDLSRYFFIKKLPKEKYVCGKRYFQLGNRHFAGDNPCVDCIVVHNNWMVTKEAKRYRFREAHLWMHDENGYFSDIARKYLTYKPPVSTNYTEEIKLLQLKSLQTALFIGHVLNRTVILPKFRCKEVSPECPLNGLIQIAALDDVFGQKYRESTFLSHPKVPAVIALSENSTVHSFQNNKSQRQKQEKDVNRGSHRPSRHYLSKMFGDIERPVLHFGLLHELYANSSVPDEETDFRSLLSRAFVESSYSQMV